MSQEAKAQEMIVVNGEKRSIPGDGDVLSLLRELGIEPDQKGVAIAINGELVPRQDWGPVRLTAGDHVDLVRAVQGG